ncbi:uncharacterized protein LOC115331911 [Ixodes scapularis]|uniref:uncharacterized protein LOC115331911 n=1 Tax=Ixodes scapularis TaxID=6945 RepID=UPI001A9E3495|nr:uncharacterized protein LOC115331911 [Ixodes scapularis]
MGLLYATLFACIATTCAWQAQMIIKNPENHPKLNDPQYGVLQNAWKAINKSEDDPFVLMFRSKNHEPNTTCVVVTATLHNETLKIVNFTRTYFNKTDEQNHTLRYQVRALSQFNYKTENVIRAGLGGTPSDKPTPLGSNMYIEYGDYSCNSSSKPLSDRLKAVNDAKGEAVSAEPVEGVNYLDFYVVFNQPQCNILKSPLLRGGCDFWLRKSELPGVLERAERFTKSIPPKVEDRQAEENPETAAGREDITKEKTPKFADALFRSLPISCRYAFISACGYPNDMMYDKNICKNTQTAKTSSSLY